MTTLEEFTKQEKDKRRQLWSDCAHIPNGQAMLREMEINEYNALQARVLRLTELEAQGDTEAGTKLYALLPRFYVLQDAYWPGTPDGAVLRPRLSIDVSDG